MMLFGDAGSATLLKVDREATDSKFLLKTKGEGYKNLIIPYGGYRHWQGSYERSMRNDGTIRSDYDCIMNGTEVFKFSITEVPKLIREFVERMDCNFNDISTFAFHQANMFIIKNIAKRLRIDEDKLAFSIDDYGNTGSTSIPMSLCNHYSKNPEKNEIEEVIICGFGIGLSLGVASIKINPANCYPIICSDDIYDDEIESVL